LLLVLVIVVINEPPPSAAESQMTLLLSSTSVNIEKTTKKCLKNRITVADTVALARARYCFIALAGGGRGIVERTGLPAVIICRKHVINALLCCGKYTDLFLIY